MYCARVSCAQGDAMSGPSPHPDPAVHTIQALAEPLTIADMAFRQAGNHTGLDEIDNSLRDVLTAVRTFLITRFEPQSYTIVIIYRFLLSHVSDQTVLRHAAHTAALLSSLRSKRLA